MKKNATSFASTKKKNMRETLTSNCTKTKDAKEMRETLTSDSTKTKTKRNEGRANYVGDHNVG